MSDNIPQKYHYNLCFCIIIIISSSSINVSSYIFLIVLKLFKMNMMCFSNNEINTYKEIILISSYVCIFIPVDTSDNKMYKLKIHANPCKILT